MVINRGLFVTFEGIDGSGKTTQAWRLWRRLNNLGFLTHIAWEPGVTELGQHLRQLLIERATGMTARAEAMLFVAARAELVETFLRPFLSQGDIVVCDRYTDSTVAYQGHGRGIDLGLIEKLNEVATGGLAPDLTVLLDVPIAVGLLRKWGPRLPLARDRFEGQEVAFQERVREGYLQMARAEPTRFIILDGTRSSEDLEDAIWERVRTMLAER